MNRVITAFCIILAISCCSVLSAVVIRHENNEIIGIIDQITAYNQSGDSKKASEAAEILNMKWYTFERKIGVFVRDDKVQEISASVARVKPYLEEANDELEAELQNISRRLNTIYLSELPVWYHVF